MAGKTYPAPAALRRDKARQRAETVGPPERFRAGIGQGRPTPVRSIDWPREWGPVPLRVAARWAGVSVVALWEALRRPVPHCAGLVWEKAPRCPRCRASCTWERRAGFWQCPDHGVRFYPGHAIVAAGRPEAIHGSEARPVRAGASTRIKA